MKALSLWQPWAEMIFQTDEKGLPLKPDETRGWSTEVRGTIAIHAAKKPLREVFKWYPQLGGWISARGISERYLAFGALIGTVEIVTVFLPWKQSGRIGS